MHTIACYVCGGNGGRKVEKGSLQGCKKKQKALCVLGLYVHR